MLNQSKATPRPLSYQEELCHIGSVLGFSPDMGNGVKKAEAVMKALHDARKSNEALLEACREAYNAIQSGNERLEAKASKLLSQAIANATK